MDARRAQGGIPIARRHERSAGRPRAVWIPACAGMTWEGVGMT